MTDFLSRDPEVTALALKIYDRDLPQPLASCLREHIPQIGDDDGEALELPTIPKAALRDMSDEQLMESLERNQETRAYLSRKHANLAMEQDRRASLWTPLEDPGIAWKTERKANSAYGTQLSSWARGYVSGANVMQKYKDNIFAKNAAELEAMMSWLDAYCRAHPSENLVVGTDQLVKMLVER